MASAQTLTYYKNKRGIYTAAQMDSLLASNDKAVAEKGFGQMMATREITGEERSGDTLFYLFKLVYVNREIVKKDELRNAKFVGKPLPGFTLPDINGKMVGVEDLKGKPVVLNLWFTTCPPCIAEMPDLNKIKSENPDITFLAITYDEKEKVSAFLKNHPFDFRQITDAKSYVGSLTEEFPTTFFIDKNGIVRAITSGSQLDRLDRKKFDKAFSLIR